MLVNKHKHKHPLLTSSNWFSSLKKNNFETKIWLPSNWSLFLSFFYFNSPYLFDSSKKRKHSLNTKLLLIHKPYWLSLSLSLSLKMTDPTQPINTLSLNDKAVSLLTFIPSIILKTFCTSLRQLLFFSKSERHVSTKPISYTFHNLSLFLNLL